MAFDHLFALFVAILYVLLALTEKKSLFIRVAYLFVAALLTTALILTFNSNRSSVSVESSNVIHGNFNQIMPTPALPRGIEFDTALKWAAHGFGLWLAVVATGELLRLILKRPAGTELLSPVILFLVGALLIEPHWSLGVALIVALACLVAIALWSQKSQSAVAEKKDMPEASRVVETP